MPLQMNGKFPSFKNNISKIIASFAVLESNYNTGIKKLQVKKFDMEETLL